MGEFTEERISSTRSESVTVDPAEDDKPYTSVRRIKKEGFSGFIVEVHPCVTDRGKEVLESLGAVCHEQIQRRDAPEIVLIPDAGVKNFGSPKPFEGFNVVSTSGLEQALQIGYSVLTISRL
ncbi:MAG TPA: hypothetical protein VH234_03710 [Candidatus Saccharimonadales bacterium]|jgi:hypothetical protein|nr:hypothetical protein [Candidatus Saccharimonadales bacterium]